MTHYKESVGKSKSKGQVAYRGLSAKQRAKLRADARRRAGTTLLGIAEFLGNGELSRYVKLSLAEAGSKVRCTVTGPAGTHQLLAYYQSGRLGPGGPVFLYLNTDELLAPALLGVFGLGHNAGRDVWQFAIEDAALTDERFAKLLRSIVASSKSCHLVKGDIVCRVYQLNDTYFVEYVDLINHPGRVVLSSLESFLGAHCGD